MLLTPSQISAYNLVLSTRSKLPLVQRDYYSESPDLISKALRISVPVQIEGHLVFKNTVPMQLAWQIASKIRLSLFEELDRL